MDSTSEQNDRIFKNAYVDVYLSGYNSMLQYPYIMGSVDYSSPKMSKSSDIYLLDSAIGKNQYDNDDVIETARHVDADVVVPKDSVDDAKSALDAAEYVFDNTNRGVIVPIQAGDKSHKYWAEKAYDRFGEQPWAYAVGGMKDAGASAQISAAREVREVLGDGVKLHMFGGGMSPIWISAIRNAPSLIDTLDVTTAVSIASHGKLVHADASQHRTGNIRGTHSTVRSARIAELSAMNFCYMISPIARESDVEEILE